MALTFKPCKYMDTGFEIFFPLLEIILRALENIHYSFFIFVIVT